MYSMPGNAGAGHKRDVGGESCAFWRKFEQLHREMLRIVRDDEICRRPMSSPGVGPLVAITFKSAIDDPGRIAKSKTIGALLGLVPKKYQSGERDVSGGITRTGDESVRTALNEAANVMLTRTTRSRA
jgi:transposase